MSTRIIVGDCRDVLKTLPDASVDSIVTDPPIPADTIPIVLPEMLTLEQFIEAYADKEPEHEAVAE